jgi:hypothetical protein
MPRGFSDFVVLVPTDMVAVPPKGDAVRQSSWFGHWVRPQWADHEGPRAYPFTARRLDWMVEWTMENYHVDPNRVYAQGGSMGAWGSMRYGLTRPAVFAAVYPDRPRTRMESIRGFDGWHTTKQSDSAPMPDGRTDAWKKYDLVRHVVEYEGELPFVGWGIGRRDGFASWPEQVDMVRAMTEARRGFAVSWNNGDHNGGKKAMGAIWRQYPPKLFALDRSYPAFTHSSIDQDMGPGAPSKGDLEGGINLGFSWEVTADEAGEWSASISNSLCKEEMTVDVTPRRCQAFKPKPGAKLTWTTSRGDTGQTTTDKCGLATLEKVRIQPGKKTVVTITVKP